MEKYNPKRNTRWSYLVAILLILLVTVIKAHAAAPELSETEARMQVYEDFAYASGIPWYEIAAIDQYERNIDRFREETSDTNEASPISIKFPPAIWSGPEAPLDYETNPVKIGLFGGIGRDGDGDGYADPHNMQDVMYTLVDYVRSFDSFESAVRAYYEHEDAIRIVLGIARLFEHFETIELDARAFPISTWHSYSFSNGYGAARGWGGRRSHEGIDIFAGYGVPVTSTSYGIVEIVGWNEYGGYRVGIRDIYNTYQYYAHLQGFAEGIEEGAIVEPGQVIGSVGSTGYGPEGTSGKFDPHLHFGLYKFDGRKEWAFNPYPHLLRWEQMD
ncbi:MAG: M23 family metallopeptidase [Defluviitaleaceae bacterium]|nr:M23 family metallopeptidase [Defluviitaleaceae bacterium]